VAGDTAPGELRFLCFLPGVVIAVAPRVCLLDLS